MVTQPQSQSPMMTVRNPRLYVTLHHYCGSLLLLLAVIVTLVDPPAVSEGDVDVMVCADIISGGIGPGQSVMVTLTTSDISSARSQCKSIRAYQQYFLDVYYNPHSSRC